jgi:hypothetical protein
MLFRTAIHFGPTATVFDTREHPGQPTAKTAETHSHLADWKGERSRRVPGEVSTAANEVSEERSEPRAHESARASGEFSGSAPKTQSTPQP